eukprot:g80269.t1
MKLHSEFQAAQLEATERNIDENKLRGGSWNFEQDPDGIKALQVYNQSRRPDKPAFDAGFLVQPEFSALIVTIILFRHCKEICARWNSTENKQAITALAKLQRDGGDVTVDDVVAMQQHVNGRMLLGGFFPEVTKEELVGLPHGYLPALAYSLVNGLCADQYGKTGAAEMKVYAKRQALRHEWNLFLYNVFWIVTNTPSLRWPLLFPVLEEEQKQRAGGGAAPVPPKPSKPQVNSPERLYPNLSQPPSPQMGRAQRVYPILPQRPLPSRNVGRAGSGRGSQDLPTGKGPGNRSATIPTKQPTTENPWSFSPVLNSRPANNSDAKQERLPTQSVSVWLVKKKSNTTRDLTPAPLPRPNYDYDSSSSSDESNEEEEQEPGPTISMQAQNGSDVPGALDRKHQAEQPSPATGKTRRVTFSASPNDAGTRAVNGPSGPSPSSVGTSDGARNQARQSSRLPTAKQVALFRNPAPPNDARMLAVNAPRGPSPPNFGKKEEIEDEQKELQEPNGDDENQGLHGPDPADGAREELQEPNEGDENQGLHDPDPADAADGAQGEPQEPNEDDENQGLHDPDPADAADGAREELQEPNEDDENQGLHDPDPADGAREELQEPNGDDENQGLHDPDPADGAREELQEPNGDDENQGLHGPDPADAADGAQGDALAQALQGLVIEETEAEAMVGDAEKLVKNAADAAQKVQLQDGQVPVPELEKEIELKLDFHNAMAHLLSKPPTVNNDAILVIEAAAESTPDDDLRNKLITFLNRVDIWKQRKEALAKKKKEIEEIRKAMRKRVRKKPGKTRITNSAVLPKYVPGAARAAAGRRGFLRKQLKKIPNGYTYAEVSSINISRNAAAQEECEKAVLVWRWQGTATMQVVAKGAPESCWTKFRRALCSAQPNELAFEVLLKLPGNTWESVCKPSSFLEDREVATKQLEGIVRVLALDQLVRGEHEVQLHPAIKTRLLLTAHNMLFSGTVGAPLSEGLSLLLPDTVDRRGLFLKYGRSPLTMQDQQFFRQYELCVMPEKAEQYDARFCMFLPSTGKIPSFVKLGKTDSKFEFTATTKQEKSKEMQAWITKEIGKSKAVWLAWNVQSSVPADHWTLIAQTISEISTVKQVVCSFNFSDEDFVSRFVTVFSSEFNLAENIALPHPFLMATRRLRPKQERLVLLSKESMIPYVHERIRIQKV